MAIRTCVTLMLFLVAVHAADSSAQPVTTTLDLTDTNTPYTMIVRLSVPSYKEDQPFMRGNGGSGLMAADLDGDGNAERIIAREGAIFSHSISPLGGGQNRWWFNLPPDFTWSWPSASLLGAVDADGDLRSEVLAVGQDHTSHRWRLVALAGDDGELLLDAPLLDTVERREDGIWDGSYGLAGTLAVPTAAGPRAAYILYAAAGYDLQPRGVLAVDAHDGSILWFRPMAGKPHSPGCRVVDLEGDGVAEILVSTVAVANYPDSLAVDGMRDDAVHVSVLEADGRTRWLRSHSAAGGGSGITALDVDGDGRLEVVDWTSLPGQTHNCVTVRDAADGHTIDSLELDSTILNLEALPSDGERPVRILMSQYGVGLELYSWQNQHWRLERRVEAPAQLSLKRVYDLLPTPGLEIFAGILPGRAVVLDEDLRLLAISPATARINCLFSPLFAQDGSPMLMAHPNRETPGALFALEPAAGQGPSPLLLLGMIPIAAAGALVIRRRRQHMPASGMGRRESRLQLLGQLELASHGAIGLLKTLRRVVWLGKAAPVAPDNEGPRIRLLELGRECLQNSLPTVEGLLQLADAAEVEDRLVLRAKESLALVRQELQRLHEGAFDRAALDDHLPDLASASADLERDLQRLRDSLKAEFRSDVAAVTQRILTLLEDEIHANGVTVSTPDPDDLYARMDPEELAFVLDNLIQNALRAMAAAPERHLSVAWELRDGAVVCEVTDTGLGIVPDDWERIFEVGCSTREGGGLGLPRSRDLLRKYEGSLIVASSEPGKGTVMHLRLPRAIGLVQDGLPV